MRRLPGEHDPISLSAKVDIANLLPSGSIVMTISLSPNFPKLAPAPPQDLAEREPPVFVKIRGQRDRHNDASAGQQVRDNLTIGTEG